MVKLKFNVPYFVATILIFLIEVLIATELKGVFFVRAYLGDVIVVMLLYTFIKSFIKVHHHHHHHHQLIFGIFIFSCWVEFAQYFNIAEKLGFQSGSLMYIIIGNSFSWVDILCYAVGCLLLSAFVQLKVAKR